ncbi:hypothetical protein Moror_13367 [Moniliophthora roreri MCA 2997]|uniref:Uncharacterized protein n=1 Tax=Moniliophthora roreri (strain MCA 2997) TaxID=1381753 RepID=V2WKL4_MONRO|nr:hypothetical protein Moror_13367 [Moniliophthora roreri MCA 2997]
MGMLAQHISEDETFTVTGAIAVPRPSLDIANLPLHVILPDTDPDGDRFATDEDVNPNDPAFLRKVIAHRRGLKRATEISKGQFLLQLRQRCVRAVQTSNPLLLYSPDPHNRTRGCTFQQKKPNSHGRHQQFICQPANPSLLQSVPHYRRRRKRRTERL